MFTLILVMKWVPCLNVSRPQLCQTVGLSYRSADSNVVMRDTQGYRAQTGQRRKLGHMVHQDNEGSVWLIRDSDKEHSVLCNLPKTAK